MTPNKNYKVNKVTVDGASKGAITTCTFSDINANHTMSVTFKKK